jgi:hypothetical protein
VLHRKMERFLHQWLDREGYPAPCASLNVLVGLDMGQCAKNKAGIERAMENECLDLELIRNRDVITAIWLETSSLGQLLVCHGCSDVDAVIVAFLVSEESREAWALCGSCLRSTAFVAQSDEAHFGQLRRRATAKEKTAARVTASHR